MTSKLTPLTIGIGSALCGRASILRSRQEKIGSVIVWTKEGQVHTIFLASEPPDWAEMSSTIRLIAMVSEAMASAGATEASAPAL